MRERPIIFSGPMVRAILESRKTQTRRVIKPPFKIEKSGENGQSITEKECPHGVPGDRLWVRETWALAGGFAPVPASKLDGDVFDRDLIRYRADGCGYDEATQAWRPSTHMPRWASRITLEITAVRVERVQDISYEDCLEEGIERPGIAELEAELPLRKIQFRTLWDTINAKRGFGWSENPWVWVIEFKKEEVDMKT